MDEKLKIQEAKKVTGDHRVGKWKSQDLQRDLFCVVLKAVQLLVRHANS